jgi:integrase
MAKGNSTPRERSLALLKQALTTGIRGRNHEAIQAAIEVLEDDGRGGLTDLHYKNLPAGQTLRDQNRRGLWFRNNKSGAIWLFNYTSPVTGEVKARQFGYYPATSLVHAREKYQEFRDALRQGRDPFLEGEETESQVTVKELCERFIKEYAIGSDPEYPRKRSWREDQRIFDYDLVSEFGDRPVVSITDDDVEDLLFGVVDRGAPRSAEKLQTAARKCWNEAIKLNRRRGEKAVRRRWVPGLKDNPWANVELSKRKTQSVFLNESQIRSFLRNLPKTTIEQVYQDALLLQFLTAARVGEVAGLLWDEIDFRHKVWNLPAERSKNKQAHGVLLSDQAITLLKRRKKESISEYVFPAPRSSGYVAPTLIARHLKSSRAKLKVPDGFSTHGLRHTALTQIAKLGYGKHIRDRISNHKDTSIDSTYQHYEYDKEARECWQVWANRLDAFGVDKVTVLEHKVAGNE